MNQPVNSSKPVGQQLTTSSAVSDQNEVQPRPARGPEKPRASQSVAERPPSIGAWQNEVLEEAGDGDASEATMLAQKGRQFTGRSSDDAQNPIAPPTEVERRAAPIESPSSDYEGEGRTNSADEGGIQTAPTKSVGSAHNTAKEDEPLEAQEKLVIASSTLDASAIGTLSGAQRFKKFSVVFEKEPFVSQRNALTNLMQIQMRTVNRLLG